MISSFPLAPYKLPDGEVFDQGDRKPACHVLAETDCGGRRVACETVAASLWEAWVTPSQHIPVRRPQGDGYSCSFGERG